MPSDGATPPQKLGARKECGHILNSSDELCSRRRQLKEKRANQRNLEESQNATKIDGKPSPLTMQAIASNNEVALPEQSRQTLVLGQYPVTTTLLWAVHFLYFVQWKRKGRKIPNKLTYNTLVKRKQFYKLWLTLLSQYRPFNNGIMGNYAGDRSVIMGNNDNEAAFVPTSNIQYLRGVIDTTIRSVHDRIPNGWLESRAALRIQHLVRISGSAIFNVYAAAGGRSVLLLLYNSHILWNCRALEHLYGSESSLSYIRLLVSVCLWATLLEVGISHSLLGALTGMYRIMQSETTTTVMLRSVGEEDGPDQHTISRLRNDILNRNLGTSWTMMSAALLMIFRLKFSYVAVPVLPWLSVTRWLFEPNLSYLISLILLYYFSMTEDSKSEVWMAMAIGSIVGAAWGSEWLDFCASAYWGNGVLLVALILTVLSLKAKKPDASYLAWVDHISCNARGGMLWYDSHLNRWYEEDSTDDNNDYVSDDAMSESGESERAFPTMDDQEIYGRSTSAVGDIIAHSDSIDPEDDNGTDLIPLLETDTMGRHSGQVRSRKGGSFSALSDRNS